MKMKPSFWHSLTSIIFQGGAIPMLQGMETAEQSYIFIPSIKKCQHMDSRLNALQACNGIVLWFAHWVILSPFYAIKNKFMY